MRNDQILDTCNYVLDNYPLPDNSYLYRDAYHLKNYTKRKIWNRGHAYLGRKHEIDAFIARVIASTQPLTLNGSNGS